MRIRRASGSYSKYITFGWLGFANGIVRWKYNDTDRPAGIVGSQDAVLTTVQAAMSQWSNACNVTFIYEGLTTLGPSEAPPTNSSDAVNVVGWRNMNAPQTGVTGVGASGPVGGPYTINEADIAFNYSYNPIFPQTALHEVGHMIGIDHSNFNGVVMSGPPSSTYNNQGVLQPDDISACAVLYPGPPNPSRTISGTILNGGAVSGVTFCARPSAGVTCNASNGSGYSCTVPNGWAGTLHSRSVSNNRIPAQVFPAVTTNTTRNVTALPGVPSCNLDVDDNGLFEPDIDGVAIVRRMMGFSSAAFAGLSGSCAANTTASAISNATSAVANYNVTGGALTRPGTDGLVILRAMRGLTNTAVTNGLGLTNEAGATRTTWGGGIQNFLNTTCGASF